MDTAQTKPYLFPKDSVSERQRRKEVKDEMKEQAGRALEEILNTALQVKDFVVGQAPEVIRQLLAWEFAWAVVGLIIGVIMILVFILALRAAWQTGHEVLQIIYVAVTVVSGIMVIPLVLCNLYTVIQIKVAPAIFLLEYAKTFGN